MGLRFREGDFAGAREVRTRVFVEEQGFQDEFDVIDESPDTIHVTLYVDGKIAGCSRVFPDGDHPEKRGRWMFGRLSILPEMRQRGLGSALLRESERIARSAGAIEMHLHAQCRVAAFYERAGYHSYGSPELDEHVEHIWMKKTL